MIEKLIKLIELFLAFVNLIFTLSKGKIGIEKQYRMLPLLKFFKLFCFSWKQNQNGMERNGTVTEHSGTSYRQLVR